MSAEFDFKTFWRGFCHTYSYWRFMTKYVMYVCGCVKKWTAEIMSDMKRNKSLILITSICLPPLPHLWHPPSGVFITKGDVGVGTIVGSAVFNILVIIGLSGIFAGQVEHKLLPTSCSCSFEDKWWHVLFLSTDRHSDMVVSFQRFLLLHPVCADSHLGEMFLKNKFKNNC